MAERNLSELPSSLTAARRAGTTTYFTGRPCKHGHISERRTNTSNCVACQEIYVRKWAKEHPESRRRFCNKYEKTKKGFLMRLYRNMQSRIDGVQKAKHHLYAGKSLLPRRDFYDWALACPEYHRLFDAYEASGFDRHLAPSVDRVDSSRGYEIANMEWVTHSENSRRGQRSKYQRS